MLPNWFYSSVKNALNYNVLFIIFSTSLYDNISDFKSLCDYCFVTGNIETIYDRFSMLFSGNSSGTSFRIASKDIEKPFKKYNLGKFNDVKTETISYDELLGF